MIMTHEVSARATNTLIIPNRTSRKREMEITNKISAQTIPITMDSHIAINQIGT